MSAANLYKSFAEFRSEISIIELALGNGYLLDKSKGAKWPVLRSSFNDETIIIVNPNSSSNQGYFNPDNDLDKGTLINFIKNRLGTVFQTDLNKSEVYNINKVLYSCLKIDLDQRNKYQSEYIPKKVTKSFSPETLLPLQNLDYLKSRGITTETASDAIFKGRIFNTRIGPYLNIAFPFWNDQGIITGIEERNKDYKHFVESSVLENSVWHSNFPLEIEYVTVFESVIDALSYFQLKHKKNTFYISIGGSLSDGQLRAIEKLMEGKSLEKVTFVSAVDQDKSGDRYTKKFEEWFNSKTIVRDLPLSKDFNKDLESYNNSKL